MGSMTLELIKAFEKVSRVIFIRGLDECWEWPQKTNRNGYGIVRVGRKTFMVHKLMYPMGWEMEEGEVLDHKCRNRLCCNPRHLEPVSVRENTLRGEGPTAQNARKTECPRGHKYDAQNTKIRPCGRRQCLACSRKGSKQR